MEEDRDPEVGATIDDSEIREYLADSDFSYLESFHKTVSPEKEASMSVKKALRDMRRARIAARRMRATVCGRWPHREKERDSLTPLPEDQYEPKPTAPSPESAYLFEDIDHEHVWNSGFENGALEMQIVCDYEQAASTIEKALGFFSTTQRVNMAREIYPADANSEVNSTDVRRAFIDPQVTFPFEEQDRPVGSRVRETARRIRMEEVHQLPDLWRVVQMLSRMLRGAESRGSSGIKDPSLDVDDVLERTELSTLERKTLLEKAKRSTRVVLPEGEDPYQYAYKASDGRAPLASSSFMWMIYRRFSDGSLLNSEAALNALHTYKTAETLRKETYQ